MGQPTGDFRQDGLRPRTGEVVSGKLLLTVGTPDGSEARHCPDDWHPDARKARGQAQTRPALGPSPAVGPLALGSGPADLPLLDREADIAQLLGLLAEGRSIRLVGQAGSGRSALLAAVAEAAGGLAPDGVVRLSGHRRTAADLLQDLFAATHYAPGFRPDPAQLATLLAGVGPVVVIDDVEVSGTELDELLAAAPESAFLVSVPPAAPQLPLDSRLTDHLVAGLSRPACLNLVARLAGRALDDAERAWAIDLWFESEGLPLRFVQAAALLRQRDAEVDTLVAAQEDRREFFGLVQEVLGPEDPAELEGELRRSVALPSVAESAAPAVRLAEGLSEPAQQVLRLAVALGGECPTAPHLPALINVGLGESALLELVDCGLAISIGGHHRLTSGVLEPLATHWQPGDIAHGAAQHFSWWVGHGSVDPAQIAAEAEVLIGALLADRAADRPEAVLQLARAAAPALALSLRWGAWERALQLGLEAARNTDSGADEAWFHHELGVRALCLGTAHRATAELEAAVALRAALGELRGSAGARRMLDMLQNEVLQLPPAPAELPQSGRRPMIRGIAAVPFRFRADPKTGRDTRRTVLAASAAVLAVGVLGTAIGLSVAGPSKPTGRVQPDGSVEDGAVPGDITFGKSPSASATDTPSPSGSSSASPSPTDSSSATTKKPGPGKTTTSPTDTPAVTPPAPVTTPPKPKPSTTSPAPSSSSPSSAPPSTSPPASPSPSGSTP